MKSQTSINEKVIQKETGKIMGVLYQQVSLCFVMFLNLQLVMAERLL